MAPTARKYRLFNCLLAPSILPQVRGKGDGEALAPTGQSLLILYNIRSGPSASNLFLATRKSC